MMTPRSPPSSGVPADMRSAARRTTLKVPIVFTVSTCRWVNGRGEAVRSDEEGSEGSTRFVCTGMSKLRNDGEDAVKHPSKKPHTASETAAAPRRFKLAAPRQLHTHAHHCMVRSTHAATHLLELLQRVWALLAQHLRSHANAGALHDGIQRAELGVHLIQRLLDLQGQEVQTVDADGDVSQGNKHLGAKTK